LQVRVPAGLDRREAEVWAKVDPARLPRHIAIIMDGNGRWAKRRHLPRVAGHRAGMTAVRQTMTTASNIGIQVMTLYAFSEENWKRRPKTEVSFLMALLQRYLKQEVPTFNKNNVRVGYIGRTHEFAPEIQARMQSAVEATSHNTGLLMNLALNYSARSELVDAVNEIIRTAAANGGLDHAKVTEELISRHLYTSSLPDPDLVIRTSGEMRLSNFLLWQIAYAEIFVTPVLWPDFNGVQLLNAIYEFQQRERRFGGLTVHEEVPEELLTTAYAHARK
jgi:undecaprenyl diphosphate synthase